MSERPVFTVLKESVVVGLATIAAAFVLYKINKHYLQKALDVYGVLFLVGFFLHLGFEYTGINRWYCEEVWPNSQVETCGTAKSS